jgi:phospholipase C
MPRAVAPQDPAAAARRSLASRTIQHVISVVQENRGFNHLFKGFPRRPHAELRPRRERQEDTATRETRYQRDIDHALSAFFPRTTAGKWTAGTPRTRVGRSIPKNFAYAYAIRSEIEQYWTMAKQYALADPMLQSNLDGSFVAH